MRNLLVPVARHDLMPSVLATALLVARRFSSYVEGFALRPDFDQYLPISEVGPVWLPDDVGNSGEAQAARAEFERFMAEHGVARGSGPELTPVYDWLENASPGVAFVGQHARLFDATVLGRPGSRPSQPPSTLTLETVLFESGRPILIAPPEIPDTIGETVVIAWNGSTETARAVAFAKPFLRRARRAAVVAVDNLMVPGPKGEEVAAALQRDGLEVESIFVTAGPRSAGELFLETASSLGCDLLIKGAYTQSRLREMIFGGATSHILAHATVPVLMAH